MDNEDTGESVSPMDLESPELPPSVPTQSPSQFPSTLPPQDSPSWSDYATDLFRGPVHGALGFASSLGDLANDVSGLFGANIINPTTLDELGNVAKPKTWLGSLTSGLTQFALGFVPALGYAGDIAGGLGLADEAGELTAAGKWAAHTLAAGGADFTDFDGHSQRLSNLIQQFPALQNPITDFLQAKDNDSWATARIKSVLEGFGVGQLTGLLMKGLTAYKGMGQALGQGDTQGAMQIAKQAAEDIKPDTDALTQAAGAGEIPQGTSTANATLPDQAKTIPVNPDSVIENFKQQVANGIDPVKAVQDTATGFLNHSKILASTDVHRLAQAMSDELANNADLSTTHAQIIQEGLDFYRGQGDTGTLGMMQQDAGFAQKLSSRLFVYRTMLAAATSQILSQVQKSIATGAGITPELFDQFKNVYTPIASGVQQITTGLAQAMNAMAIPVSAETPLVSKAMNAIEQLAVKGTKGPVFQAQATALLQSLVAEPDDITKVFQGFAKLQDSGTKAFWQWNQGLLMGAMLSAPKTQIATALNNMAMTLLQPGQRILGGILSGNTDAIQSGARLYAGLFGAATDMFRLTTIADQVVEQSGSTVGNSLKAFTQAGLQREAGSGAIEGSFGWLSSAISLPMKLLNMTDTFFQGINARAYLRDQAMQIAERSGIAPNNLTQFVSDFINSGYDSDGNVADEAAKLWGQKATFTQSLAPGSIAGDVQQFANNHPLFRLFAPFIRTSANILDAAAQYTPGLNLMMKNFQAELTHTDPLIRSDAWGRFYTGGLFWTLATAYGLSGQITGGGPQSPDEKEQLEATGWRPYSIVSTAANGQKSYLSYNRLDPFGIIFGLASDFAETTARMDDLQRDSYATTLTTAIARNLNDKTYFRGISQLMGILSGQTSFSEAGKELAGQYVPSLISNLNQDPNLRDTRNWLDEIRSKIPGLSESLPPQRNLFGEPTPTPAGYLPWGESGSEFARVLSPAAYSQQVDDPVKQELANLDFGFGKPSKIYQGFDLSKWTNPDTGQDAYDRLQQLMGQVGGQGRTMADALSGLIKSPGYQSLPAVNPNEDEAQKMLNPRVKEVQSIIGSYRQMALYQMLREYPQIATAIRQQRVAAMTPSSSSSPIMQKLAQAQ